MKCPKCGSLHSECLDSRQHDATRIRRYICYNCGEKYKTIESVGELPKKSICSHCLVKKNADALCKTCSLAIAAEGWKKRLNS